jgi:enoyl-CoA hydratase/carnithine racemase
MSLSDELVLSERLDRVLLVTLNRPSRLNAWTDELEEQYFDVLTEADANPGVRAVVVTGAGRGFCAGADMENLKAATSGSLKAAPRNRPRDLPLTIQKPMIGAINGVAAGLGVVEALYFDVRFGSPNTRFTTAFVRRGLIAEYGIAWLLPRVVGTSRATDLLLSGRMVDAEEAHRIGLLDYLVKDTDVVSAAIDYANELSQFCSPRSMASIKDQIHRSAHSSYEDSVADANKLMLQSFRLPDVAEGVASYLEKRSPEFPGFP